MSAMFMPSPGWSGTFERLAGNEMMHRALGGDGWIG